jgi:hypothetical protein
MDFKREKFEKGVYKGIVDTLNEIISNDTLEIDNSQFIFPNFQEGTKPNESLLCRK